MITYHITGRRDDAKQVADNLAGNWIIASHKSPYALIEQHDLESLMPLDDKSPDDIREEAQIIKDNLDAALHLANEKEQ